MSYCNLLYCIVLYCNLFVLSIIALPLHGTFTVYHIVLRHLFLFRVFSFFVVYRCSGFSFFAMCTAMYCADVLLYLLVYYIVPGRYLTKYVFTRSRGVFKSPGNVTLKRAWSLFIYSECKASM